MREKVVALTLSICIAVVLFSVVSCKKSKSEAEVQTRKESIQLQLKDTVYSDVERNIEQRQSSEDPSTREVFLVEIAEDGTVSEIKEELPLNLVVQSKFMEKSTYEVEEILDETCLVRVKVPDYKAVFSKALGINEITFESLDSIDLSYNEVLTNMISILESDEIPWMEQTIEVPYNNGELQISDEIKNVLSGGMISFQEEFFAIILEM